MEISIEDIICPITMCIFREPVVAPDNFTYEKSAIEQWIKNNKNSPLTGKPMKLTGLYPNQTLQNLIIQYLEKNPEKRKEQYRFSYKFCNYINEIKQIITKGEFEKLLDYIEFDYSVLKSKKLLDKLLYNCKNDEILYHFIDNCKLTKKNNLIQYFVSSSVPFNIQKYIIDSTTNMDIKMKHGKCLIHYAIKNNNTEIIKYIISKNINVNACDDFGNNAFHLISDPFNEEIAKILLEAGVNIDECNAENLTPLNMAIRSGNKDAILFFLENKANKTIADTKGKLPIHYCLKYLDDTMCVKLMDYFMDKYSTPTRHGKYPIHYACKYRSLEVIKTLVKSNVNLEVVDDSGLKPIHCLALYGNNDQIMYLINNGVALNDIVEYRSRKHNLVTLFLKKKSNADNDEFMNNLLLSEKVNLFQTLRLMKK